MGLCKQRMEEKKREQEREYGLEGEGGEKEIDR